MRTRIESRNVPFQYNGREWVACVSVYLVPDQDLDLSWMNTTDLADTQQKLNQGILNAVDIVVEATAFNESGEDSLCGCLISDNADAIQTMEEHGMVQVAIDYLTASITSKVDVLKVLSPERVS